MAYQEVVCPYCQHTAVNKRGFSDVGTPRYWFKICWRPLKVSTGTILSMSKGVKEKLVQVNEAILDTVQAEDTGREVAIFCASEVDEQWSSVQNKEEQRWLWHAIERGTNTVLAYVFGARTDAVCEELYEFLRPFQIMRYYTDGWGPMRAACRPTSILCQSGRRSGLSASISRFGHGSNGWLAKQSASRNRRRCTTR